MIKNLGRISNGTPREQVAHLHSAKKLFKSLVYNTPTYSDYGNSIDTSIIGKSIIEYRKNVVCVGLFEPKFATSSCY